MNKKGQSPELLIWGGAIFLLFIGIFALNKWAIQYFDPGLFWVGVGFELVAIFLGSKASLKTATASGSAGAVFIFIAWTSAKATSLALG